MQNLCTTFNHWAWEIDYITCQPTIQKLSKKMDLITYCSALQNFECHQRWDQYVQLEEYTLQYSDVKSRTHQACGKFYINALVRSSLSSLWSNFVYLLCTLMKLWEGFAAWWKLWKVVGVVNQAPNWATTNHKLW